VKHAALTEEVVERTALYALGALTLNEARAYEAHLADGCEVCQSELDEYQPTVAAMALATADHEPSPEVRNRLLESLGHQQAADQPREVAASAPPLSMAPEFVSLHAADDSWEYWDEGIFYKPLFIDETSGLMTSLVRMLPGTGLPRHQHLGVEQFLVIEGDCIVHGECLGPGDYHRAMGGSIHETTYTETGTTFLLIAPKEYQILESR
jgi:anti-sigma factor ChrR (cupin superfamily)